MTVTEALAIMYEHGNGRRPDYPATYAEWRGQAPTSPAVLSAEMGMSALLTALGALSPDEVSNG